MDITYQQAVEIAMDEFTYITNIPVFNRTELITKLIELDESGSVMTLTTGHIQFDEELRNRELKQISVMMDVDIDELQQQEETEEETAELETVIAFLKGKSDEELFDIFTQLKSMKDD